MTPARPELAARERIAVLQQQADLARLGLVPGCPAGRTQAQEGSAPSACESSCNSRSASASMPAG
jgi:hypothetical protein